jgi:hypothetical protein
MNETLFFLRYRISICDGILDRGYGDFPAGGLVTVNTRNLRRSVAHPSIWIEALQQRRLVVLPSANPCRVALFRVWTVPVSLRRGITRLFNTTPVLLCLRGGPSCAGEVSLPESDVVKVFHPFVLFARDPNVSVPRRPKANSR